MRAGRVKYAECATTEEKIMWLDSVHGQAMLAKRPRLQQLHKEGKLKYMVNTHEWGTKLDEWLSDRSFMAALGSLFSQGNKPIAGTNPSNPCQYTGPIEPFSEAVKLSLLTEGYAILRNFIPKETLCYRAIKSINHRIGTNLQTQQGKSDIPDTKLTSYISTDPDLMNLYYNTKLASSVNNLLHGNSSASCKPQGCQIALRFPEMAEPPASNASALGGQQWHTDGMDKGDYAPFTLLIGIALSDQLETFSGNVCVFPGSHHILQDFVRSYVTKMALDGGVGFNTAHFLQNKPMLKEPLQVLVNVGDVVLLHQKLAHRGGPNYGCEVRRMVYFRVQHNRHESLKLAATENIWLEFEGMADVL